MFDPIICEAASRFGLGDKAGPLVQMLLNDITNQDAEGIAGFMSKLRSGGLGNTAQSWLGDSAGALPVSGARIESLFGGQGGLLDNITSKLDISCSTASSALGFLLPSVIGKLTPGGFIPASLASHAVDGTVPDRGTVATAGDRLLKWLPWLVAGIAALFLLSYCNKGSDAAKQAADGAKSAAATAQAAKATAGAVVGNEEVRQVETTTRK